jgi:AraC-like DNA-binding protein
MGTARPLSRFPFIDTSNPEVMRAALDRIYVKPVMELVGRERKLRAVMNHCQLKHIGIGYGEYGADVRWGFPPSDFAAQIFPINGKAEIAIDGTSVSVGGGRGVAISPGVIFKMISNASYERLILTVDAKGLASKLAAMTGWSVRAPLRLQPAQDFSSQAARLLRDNFIFLVQQLTAGTPLPLFVMAEFEQALMMMFLHANRHNYSHLLDEEPVDAAPREVRRAEEYIEANWHEPLSLEGLAAETGLSMRSLARKFRQWRGYSPSEFLQQVRLRHARRSLQNAGPAVTVADVALACGFANIARFNKDYAECFGEHPSATLAHGR